jgi:hypothetical protein
MSEKKGWGASLLGVFVVRDEDHAAAEGAPAADGAATAAGTAGTAGDAATPPDTSGVPPFGGDPAAGLPPLGSLGTGANPAGQAQPRPPGGGPAATLDLPAVYNAAGISAEEQARVSRAADLLRALPQGSDASRQIVEASLKAFGVPIDEIIAAGEKEIRALDGHVAAGAAEARQLLAESQQRISQYEQEIQRIRQVMDQRMAEQQAVERACAGSKLELARVLGFFGHAPAAPAAGGHPPIDPPVNPPQDPSERSN